MGKICRRLALALSRRRLDREMDEEMAFHLAMKARDLEAAGQSAYNVADDDDDRDTMASLAARDFDRGPARFPELRGAYLGQKPPGKRSEVFAPGLVSGRYALHGNVVFSPDGKYLFYFGKGGVRWVDAAVIQDVRRGETT
jgi:hypothetical protein